MTQEHRTSERIRVDGIGDLVGTRKLAEHAELPGIVTVRSCGDRSHKGPTLGGFIVQAGS
jgi:hypothetical protein